MSRYWHSVILHCKLFCYQSPLLSYQLIFLRLSLFISLPPALKWSVFVGSVVAQGTVMMHGMKWMDGLKDGRRVGGRGSRCKVKAIWFALTTWDTLCVVSCNEKLLYVLDCCMPLACPLLHNSFCRHVIGGARGFFFVVYCGFLFVFLTMTQ